MSLFTVDSKNVFGTGVAEAGTYNVKIVKAMVNNSSNNNQYVSIDFQVLDGTYKGGQIRYQNVTWSTDDLESSTKRFNTIAVAVGASDGVVIDSVAQFANAIKDKQLTIDVDWAEPNTSGKIYLEVRGYHKLSQDPSKPNGIKRPDTNAGNPNAGIANRSAAPTQSNDAFANSGNSIDISDDDLPF